MNLHKSFAEFRLTKPVRAFDGRWLVAGCICVYFLVVFKAPVSGGYVAAWHHLGVPAQPPSFLDLRGVIAGAESAKEGYDPQVNNPHDPLGRPGNYPSIWFSIFSSLGIHEQNTVPLGLGMAASFYVSVLLFAGHLNLWEGLAWSILVCSPPAMLAVERGNNDIVIFVLLALGLWLRRFSGAVASVGIYGLIETCAVLKLYPAVALCLALRERPRAARSLLFVTATIFAGYLYLIRMQLRAIAQVLPHPYVYAYGSHVFVDWYNADHHGVFWRSAPLLTTLVVVAFVGLACKYIRYFPALPKPRMEGLMIGSALYIFSFALNSNSNYRLIFLLFTVPASLKLLEENGLYRVLASVLLSMLVIGWTFSCQLHSRLFVVKEAANWVLFAGMLYLWAKCLPIFGSPKLGLAQADVHRSHGPGEDPHVTPKVG